MLSLYSVHVCVMYTVVINTLFGNSGLRPLGPKETDELRVPPGKAYTLHVLTDHLITC